MREDEAREVMEERVSRGGRVVSVLTAELPAIKTMQRTLLDREIPALLGPCSSGG